MTQQPSTFHPFWDLPTELRLKIWSYLLPPPRIIQLSPRANRHNSVLVPVTKPPVLLSITHESRTVGLSAYTFLPIPHIPIPISLNEDTVYVSFTLPNSPHRPFTPVVSHVIAILSFLPRLPVSSLALDSRCWDKLCNHDLISILAGMPQLREVKRVVEHGRHFEGELGLLDMPEWRSDLKREAELAEVNLRNERRKLSLAEREKEDVKVKCVFLTKGGEMA